MKRLLDGSWCVASRWDARYSRVYLPVENFTPASISSGKAHDQRTPTEKDRGRAYYGVSFRRLSGVTQILSPDPLRPAMHNRQSHSAKVALVAREIAEHLARQAETDRKIRKCIKSYGGLDIAACESAGLLHDIGHPPFGHAAERVIDEELRTPYARSRPFECEAVLDGFEGNAQSFRIALRLEARAPLLSGLGLTNVVLAALQKYPWSRGAITDSEFTSQSAERYATHEKFGAYQRDLSREAQPTSSDESYREKINLALTPEGAGFAKTLEASIMDLADDITYAVHDFEDFFAQGLLNVVTLRRDIEDTLKFVWKRAEHLSLRQPSGDAKSGEMVPETLLVSANSLWLVEQDDGSYARLAQDLVHRIRSRGHAATRQAGALSEQEQATSSDTDPLGPAESFGGSTGESDLAAQNMLLDVLASRLERCDNSAEGIATVFGALEDLDEQLANLRWGHSKSLVDAAMLRFTMSRFVKAFFAGLAVRSRAETLVQRRTSAPDVTGPTVDSLKARLEPVYVRGPAAEQMLWLKAIAERYVVSTPFVALTEIAQERTVRQALRGLEEWVWQSEQPGPGHQLPEPLQSLLPPPGKRVAKRGTGGGRDLLTWQSRRAIADYICTLSDAQCLQLAQFLQGASVPSLNAAL